MEGNFSCVRDVTHLIWNMANEMIDEGPSQGDPPMPDLPPPWSALESAQLFEDVEIQDGNIGTEIASPIDWEVLSEMPTDIKRATTPPSPNPWSTSATLPVSQEPEAHEESLAEPAHDTRPPDDISPTPWSTSATLPVSPENENHGAEEQKTPEEPPKAPKKKVFSTAEYKVAFSHFLVRKKRHRASSADTRSSESSLTRQEATNFYSQELHSAQYVLVQLCH